MKPNSESELNEFAALCAFDSLPAPVSLSDALASDEGYSLSHFYGSRD